MTSALIDQLATTPKSLAHLVAEASDARLDAANGDSWSARTVLAHFRDEEYLCMRVAVERILAETNPNLHFVEGGEWAPTRNTSRDRKELLLADFALQRQASISILRGLRPEDWARMGHTESGDQFTIRRFLEAWIRHDAEHVSQLEGLLGETVAAVIERRSRRPE